MDILIGHYSKIFESLNICFVKMGFGLLQVKTEQMFWNYWSELSACADLMHCMWASRQRSSHYNNYYWFKLIVFDPLRQCNRKGVSTSHGIISLSSYYTLLPKVLFLVLYERLGSVGMTQHREALADTAGYWRKILHYMKEIKNSKLHLNLNL